MNMIYTILILVALVFLFFWVLQSHKKTEIEAYTNNSINDIVKKFSNATITDKDKEALCAMAASTKKITQDECVELLKKHGNVIGALQIFKALA